MSDVQDNPYAAPKTAVADAPDDDATRERPVQVTVAVILMWLTLLLGSLGVLVGWDDFVSLAPRGFIVIVSIWGSLIILLNVMTMKGRNWARVTYLVLFSLGLPRFVVELRPLFEESVAAGVAGVVQMVIQGTAVVLVFTSPGRHWFRRASAVRRLFSYGSLQREEVQHRMFGRLLAGRGDEIVGFELATSRGPGAHANVIRSAREDSRVGGMVFDVTDAELARGRLRAQRWLRAHRGRAGIRSALLGVPRSGRGGGDVNARRMLLLGLLGAPTAAAVSLAASDTLRDFASLGLDRSPPATRWLRDLYTQLRDELGRFLKVSRGVP